MQRKKDSRILLSMPNVSVQSLPIVNISKSIFGNRCLQIFFCFKRQNKYWPKQINQLTVHSSLICSSQRHAHDGQAQPGRRQPALLTLFAEKYLVPKMTFQPRREYKNAPAAVSKRPMWLRNFGRCSLVAIWYLKFRLSLWREMPQPYSLLLFLSFFSPT